MVERKHPLAKCEECPLYKRGTYVEPSYPTTTGNGIAFIGESPGNQEKAKKKVFIGPSGQLLDAFLDEYNIDRSASLLTNAALCNYKVEDKDSLPAAIDACRPRLIQELKDNGVTKAVTLGGSAVKSLINTKLGITKVREGGARPSDYDESISVIPTFHPAAALRSQAYIPLMESDFKKINPKKKIWREPKITVITETKRALAFFRNTKTTYPMYLDIENGLEKERSYDHDTRLLCVGFGSSAPNHGDRVVVIGMPAILDPDVQTAMFRLVDRVGMIAQNGKHEQRVMEETNVEKMKLWLAGDTMLASYALNENPGSHGLKYMVVEHLQGPAYDDAIKPYLVKPKDPPELRGPAIEFLRRELPPGKVRIRAELLKLLETDKERKAVEHAAEEMGIIEFKDEGASYRAHQIRWMAPKEEVPLAPLDADGSFASIPPHILYKYNGYDIQATRQLDQEYLQPELNKDPSGKRFGYDHMIVMSNALARPEKNGLHVDLETNERLGRDFDRELEAVGEFPFNPGSWQQKQQYFEDAFNLKLENTQKDTLVDLRNNTTDGKIVELIDRLLEYNRITKYRSTYVSSIRNQALRNDGRVLPTFKIDQATTGRLASKNPNVQNMPRKFDIKSQFIPSSPDRVFIHADMAQLELRCITWLAQDEGMRALFNDPDRDLFDELTMIVYGMPRDEFYYKKKHDKKFIKERRVIVKAFAYGIILDRSAEGIAMDQGIGLDIPTARQKMAIFKKQIPGIIAYQDSVKRDVLDLKDLVNVFGRRRRFHTITNATKKELLRQAVAFQPQSTASDICVTALSRLPDYMDPRNIIHDAILLEAPIDRVEEHGRVLAQIMIDTAEEITGGYVKFDAEATWGYTWQDAAEPNEDESNLIKL